MTSEKAQVVEVVPDALVGERVDRVVSFITGCSRSEAANLIETGAVQRNGVRVRKGADKVGLEDQVSIDTASLDVSVTPDADPSVAVPVLHVDDHVIVVDKPAGLVVHPGAGTASGTLVNGLLAHYPEIVDVGQPERPGIVHRLDKGTSGALMVARTQAAYEHLTEQLLERSVDRRYLALAWGHVASDRGVIDARLGRSKRHPIKQAVVADGREARTHYEVVTRFDDPVPVSKVRCRLETGRTHQIRVHMMAIDHPIVGDEIYAGSGRVGITFDRPALHAEVVGFNHPATGEHMSVESPVPADLQNLFNQLA